MPEKKARKYQVTSPGVEELLQHMKDKGVINSLTVGRARIPVHSAGGYSHKNKRIAFIASSVNEGNPTALHEASHALRRSNIKPTPQKIAEYYDNLPLLDKLLGKGDIVLPKHYTDKQVGASMYNAEGTPTGYFNQGGRMGRLARKTALRRFAATTASIPEGREWSGLRKDESHALTPLRLEEGQTYYLTSPEVASPLRERAREFGAFLVDYGVPVDTVRKVVKDLGESKPVKSHRVTPSWRIIEEYLTE